MHLSSLLAFTAVATAAALPQAGDPPYKGECPAVSNEVATSRNAFLNAQLFPATSAQYVRARNAIRHFEPDTVLNITYNGKQVTYGNKFSTVETSTAPDGLNGPHVRFTKEKCTNYTNSRYLLMFVDPDAPDPSNPTQKAYLHWMVYDVRSNRDIQRDQGDNGAHVITDFRDPTPRSSAAHRYTFLLFRQPNDFVPPADQSSMSRSRFDIAAYVKKTNLTGPVAGNFFYEGTES